MTVFFCDVKRLQARDRRSVFVVTDKRFGPDLLWIEAGEKEPQGQ